MASALVLILLFLASVDRASAQAEYSSQVDVQVVNVEVVVNDKRGRQVDDLTPEDFKLLVDGQPREISNFSLINNLGGGAREASPQGEKFLLFYFDNTNIEPPQRNAFVEELRGSLRQPTTSNWQVMIVSSDGSDPRVHGGFESDRDSIESSLYEVERSAAQDLRSPAYQEAMQELRRLAGMASSAFTSRSTEAQVQVVLARLREIAQDSRRDLARTGAEIWRLTDAMAGLPGRKAFVYVGGGVAGDLGGAMFAAVRDALARTGGPEGVQIANDLPVGLDSRSDDELVQLAQRASTHGVRLYAIDANGATEVRTGGASAGSVEGGTGAAPGPEDSFAPGTSSRSRAESQSSLEVLTGLTGGFAHSSTRGFDQVLERLANDFSSYYSLGFQASDLAAGNHRVEIRLANKRLEARFRHFYQTGSADLIAANLTISTLHFGGGSNPLEIELEAGNQPANENDPQVVSLSIRIPVSNLAVEAEKDVHTGQVSIFYTAGDSQLSAAPVRKDVLPVTIRNEELLGAMGQVLDYRIDLTVLAGQEWIAVGVRDDLDSRMSTLRVPIAAPGPSSEAGL